MLAPLRMKMNARNVDGRMWISTRFKSLGQLSRVVKLGGHILLSNELVFSYSVFMTTAIKMFYNQLESIIITNMYSKKLL